MSILSLKALPDWTITAGLEHDAGLIRLAVGGGGWHADSLVGPFTALPPSPWVKIGAQFSGITNKCVFLSDTSDSDYVKYVNNWGVTAAVGGAIHTKMHLVQGASATWPHRIVIADGANIGYVAPYTGSADQYNGREVYASFKDGVIGLYYFNDITGKFDSITPPSMSASTAQRIEFGSDSIAQTGEHIWQYLKFKESYQATPFVTTSPTATMGARDVYAVVDTLPLNVTAASGASITWRYNKDGTGWTTPGAGTLAELQAAIVGTYVETLDLEATFLTDGLAQASMGLGGAIIAGGVEYHLPLQAVEIPGREVVEL